MIRNNLSEDVALPRLVKLQEGSFHYLARYGNVWHPQELQSLRLVPKKQFCAELNADVVPSEFLEPEYSEH